jgi:competence protein ComEA
MRRVTELIRNLLGLDDGTPTTLAEFETSQSGNPQRGIRWRIAVGASLILGGGAIVASIVASTVLSLGAENPVPEELRVGETASPRGEVPAVKNKKSVSGSDEETIIVYVVGAVLEPGLYSVKTHARVIDAVMAAGGLRETADSCKINLAKTVVDGEQLVVPTAPDGIVGDPAACAPSSPPGDAGSTGDESAGGSQGSSDAGSLVSLSNAGLNELDSLPGIGPALAQRILDWRAASGGFTDIEQLNEVAGIGDKVMANIRPLVTL